VSLVDYIVPNRFDTRERQFMLKKSSFVPHVGLVFLPTSVSGLEVCYLCRILRAQVNGVNSTAGCMWEMFAIVWDIFRQRLLDSSLVPMA